MAFDATAVQKALEAPEIIVHRSVWPFGTMNGMFGTKRYRGRILGHLEFMPFKERFDQLAAGELDAWELTQLLKDYLKAVGIPPKVVLRLPTKVVEEVLSDFLDLQARAVGAPGLKRSTSGKPSPRKASGERPGSRRRGQTAGR